MVVSDEPFHWIISYTLSFTVVLNTAINPFLYSFLNQTIAYIDKFFGAVGQCITNICCCFCSDFDDYEREISIHSQNFNEQRSSQGSNVVPRGPYVVDSTGRGSNHVKFQDVPVINTYPPEEGKNLGFV